MRYLFFRHLLNEIGWDSDVGSENSWRKYLLLKLVMRWQSWQTITLFIVIPSTIKKHRLRVKYKAPENSLFFILLDLQCLIREKLNLNENFLIFKKEKIIVKWLKRLTEIVKALQTKWRCYDWRWDRTYEVTTGQVKEDYHRARGWITQCAWGG